MVFIAKFLNSDPLQWFALRKKAGKNWLRMGIKQPA
jgi:hypothetical protein